MQELIYKQDAHDKLEYMYLLIERDRGQGNEVAKGLRMACKAIGDIKAVDAEMSCSVRHGRWEIIDTDANVWKCTTCGEEWMLNDGNPSDNNMLFCPHCGSRMCGGADNG